MSKNRKKHLALLLCLLLCLSLLPAMSFAEEDTAAIAEEGLEAHPAAIAEAEEDVITEEDDTPVIPETEEGDVLIEDDADDAALEADEPEADPERKDSGADPVEGFVRRGYSLILGRGADEVGLNYWMNQLKSGQLTGAGFVKGFLDSDEFRAKGASDTEVISIFYRVMMDREPDAGGMAYWMSILDKGVSYAYIINGFAASDEFGGICAASGITAGSVPLTEARDQNVQVTAFVNRNYLYALRRKGEPDGLNYWTAALLNETKTPQQTAEEFVFSEECIGRGLNDRDFLDMLYHLYMDRDPDAGGLQYWISELNAGMPRTEVAAEFAQSDEFKAIVASYGLPEEPSTEEFVRDWVTYEVLDGGILRVRSYDGTATSLTIPQTVEGYTVVEIGTSAFEGNQVLQSIDLPDSIQTIGRRAFKDCSNLRSMS